MVCVSVLGCFSCYFKRGFIWGGGGGGGDQNMFPPPPIKRGHVGHVSPHLLSRPLQLI